ncbi:hypothetical protein CCR75_007870 [Bremia lactucae]|uniref:U1 small nuclear ribonucleoprotein C n=1 Tax=Bremia lactucae TaxID=4779 RepID=A0A976FLN1_BRELC|nr:hypothetical protein CCR75_007870 [Bremia lactucae]
MPRYYCDYCDTYLTHDSQAGRKQHNRGWKHRENVKLYYEQFLAGQGVVMNRMVLNKIYNLTEGLIQSVTLAGEWLRGPMLAGSLPSRPIGPLTGGIPGGYPPRGGPPRGMMPPPGSSMRPPIFQGMPRGPPPIGVMGMRVPPGPGGMGGPPPRSIYGP